jgi:glucose-1-phosphate thymidylyltransferase
MPETLKIAIPMAGLGTRMRPHTWSKPKPLIALAGRTVLDYVLEQFKYTARRF